MMPHFVARNVSAAAVVKWWLPTLNDEPNNHEKFGGASQLWRGFWWPETKHSLRPFIRSIRFKVLTAGLTYDCLLDPILHGPQKSSGWNFSFFFSIIVMLMISDVNCACDKPCLLANHALNYI
jgi:hypothetical protein